MSFDVFQCFAFGSDGRPISAPASEFRVTCDRLQQRFIVAHHDAACALSFLDVKCVLLIEAEEKTALMKSFGRAAYIGAVAGLWRSPGRGRGGAGLSAALANLAINGAQTKSLLTGLLCFLNGVILRFEMLPESDLEALTSLMNDDVLTDESQHVIQQMWERQREYLVDGERVVDELLSDVCILCSEAALALKAIEQSPKLDQRSNHRKRVAQIAADLQVKCSDLAFASHANRLNLHTISARSDGVPADIQSAAQTALLQQAMILHNVPALPNVANNLFQAVAYRDPKRELVAAAQKKLNWLFMIVAALVAGGTSAAIEDWSDSNLAAVSGWLGLLIGFLIWWVLRSVTAWAIKNGDDAS